jgi:hypothetical protein
MKGPMGMKPLGCALILSYLVIIAALLVCYFH